MELERNDAKKESLKISSSIFAVVTVALDVYLWILILQIVARERSYSPSRDG